MPVIKVNPKPGNGGEIILHQMKMYSVKRKENNLHQVTQTDQGVVRKQETKNLTGISIQENICQG